MARRHAARAAQQRAAERSEGRGGGSRRRVSRGLAARIPRRIAAAASGAAAAPPAEHLLPLTARPTVDAALGLERTIREARRRLDPTKSSGIRLLQAAMGRLDDEAREYRRAGAAREARLTAFRNCSIVEEQLRSLVRACQAARHAAAKAAGSSLPPQYARSVHEARVATAATSEPAPTSETPRHATRSPAMVGARMRSRSSCEPKRASAGVAMSVCTPIALECAASAARARACAVGWTPGWTFGSSSIAACTSSRSFARSSRSFVVMRFTWP